jgi:hypothetical protein
LALVRAKTGGKSHWMASERITWAAHRTSALLAPNALMAAISATSVPATPPSTGEMASANGALLSPATALGSSQRTASVVLK